MKQQICKISNPDGLQFSDLRLSRDNDGHVSFERAPIMRICQKNNIPEKLFKCPVPGDQAPVRLCEDALSWPGEEHGAVGNAVRSVEPVDGAPTFNGECRRGASVIREMAAAKCSLRQKTQK